MSKGQLDLMQTMRLAQGDCSARKLAVELLGNESLSLSSCHWHSSKGPPISGNPRLLGLVDNRTINRAESFHQGLRYE